MLKNKIGIDIIGFPRGKLGIGEQCRSLVRVALAAGYKVNLIDCIHASDNIKNDDLEFDSLISNKFKYKIRIYTLTQNHIAALVYRYGVSFFNNNYNIFHLAWEFNERPIQLDPALKFSDEIWGISNFTSLAFRNDYGIPVYTFPNTVDIGQFPIKSREYFDLPNDKFIFMVSFDFNSTIIRKNPISVLDAFKKVFGNNEKVFLVIKVSNFLSIEYKEFEQHTQNQNILIINKVFSRDDILAFFNCGDAYISLHRSEGFGLGIAENMLLKKPIVCTGYSGNMDFCTSENSFLVDYNLQKVKKGEYPFSENFDWANPLVESAAVEMKELYENITLREKKVENAYQDILNKYSVNSQIETFDILINNFIKRNKIKEGKN